MKTTFRLPILQNTRTPNFNDIEFEYIKSQAGLNSFVLTSKNWIKSSNAIGLVAKAGRYGGTLHIKILNLNLHDRYRLNSGCT